MPPPPPATKRTLRIPVEKDLSDWIETEAERRGTTPIGLAAMILRSAQQGALS